MPQLIPIKLDDQTIIYIEATDEVDIPDITAEEEEEEEEEALVDKSGRVVEAQKQMVQNFRAIQGTIRAYTIYTLSAFKKMAIANVNKVTLEFGIELGGEAGVPYVTKGTAKSNLKITVECSFPDSTEQDANRK
ncbi:CU044_2847 family protein [Coleofasciculus sp. C1-SOL-03]|uniref:CU044_2847 family protein n=1 Tax=Coleofasciculus sp. C1-SOL-03 TaxID=3069522 RepID=UPI004064805F